MIRNNHSLKKYEVEDSIAFNLDGQYIDWGNQTLLNQGLNEWTIALFFYETPGTTGLQRDILLGGDPFAYPPDFDLYCTGSLNARNLSLNIKFNFAASVPYEQGKWNFYVATFDGITLKQSLNLQPITSQTGTFAIPASTENYSIGGVPNMIVRSISGLLGGALRVFNRALTEKEYRLIYEKMGSVHSLSKPAILEEVQFSHRAIVEDAGTYKLTNTAAQYNEYKEVWADFRFGSQFGGDYGFSSPSGKLTITRGDDYLEVVGNAVDASVNGFNYTSFDLIKENCWSIPNDKSRNLVLEITYSYVGNNIPSAPKGVVNSPVFEWIAGGTWGFCQPETPTDTVLKSSYIKITNNSGYGGGPFDMKGVGGALWFGNSGYDNQILRIYRIRVVTEGMDILSPVKPQLINFNATDLGFPNKSAIKAVKGFYTKDYEPKNALSITKANTEKVITNSSNLATLLNANTDITFIVTLKVTTHGSHTIMDIGRGNYGGLAFEIATKLGKMYPAHDITNIEETGGPVNFNNGTYGSEGVEIKTNEWIRLVYVYRAGERSRFAGNGQFGLNTFGKGGVPYTGAVKISATSGKKAVIGGITEAADVPGIGQDFTGFISNITIIGGAGLTDPEIIAASQLNQETSFESLGKGTLLYRQLFNEFEGSVLKDSSGNGQDAVLSEYTSDSLLKGGGAWLERDSLLPSIEEVYHITKDTQRIRIDDFAPDPDEFTAVFMCKKDSGSDFGFEPGDWFLANDGATGGYINLYTTTSTKQIINRTNNYWNGSSNIYNIKASRLSDYNVYVFVQSASLNEIYFNGQLVWRATAPQQASSGYVTFKDLVGPTYLFGIDTLARTFKGELAFASFHSVILPSHVIAQLTADLLVGKLSKYYNVYDYPQYLQEFIYFFMSGCGYVDGTDTLRLKNWARSSGNDGKSMGDFKSQYDAFLEGFSGLGSQQQIVFRSQINSFKHITEQNDNDDES